jgi:predicted RNA binding protein YcfA (HicA-like mRNA interferase family)
MLLYATIMLCSMNDGERAQALAGQAGCSFEVGRGKGGHVLVRLGERWSTLPMHGKRDLPGWLVVAIKKQLGLD